MSSGTATAPPSRRYRGARKLIDRRATADRREIRLRVWSAER
jgi:hypothetical protein